MANPTAAKPINPEWDSSANPNLRFYTVLNNATGSPVDLVSRLPARRFDGYGGSACGAWPQVSAVSFGDVVSDPIYKWRRGDTGLHFASRGWPSGTNFSTARTLFVTFRHNFARAGANAYPTSTYIITLLQASADNGSGGLALQVQANGTVRLGWTIGGNFVQAGSRTVAAGVMYSYALTLTSGTGRIYNVYDHGAQAADSQGSLTDAIGWSFNSVQNHAVLNSGFSALASGQVEIYVAGFADETWDFGTNTRFADYYTDPARWARGSYTSPGGTLTAGFANPGSNTTTIVTVTCSRPSVGTNGTAGTAYTYQWYRSTTPNYTPGPGTILTGQTARACVDSTVTPGTVYYYKCGQSDGTSTVFTSAVSTRTARGSMRLVAIGDSITAGTPISNLVTFASTTGWQVGGSNRGLGASSIISAGGSLSWIPGGQYLSAATAAAGTYTLSWRGQTTAAIAYNANAATVRAALEALSTVGSGNVTVAGTLTGGFAIQFTGASLPSPVGTTALTVDGTSFTGTTLQAYSVYGTAVAEFLEVDPTDISIALGTNDAGSSTVNVFQTAMSALVNDLRAVFPLAKIHLFAPLNREYSASDVVMERYITFQDALIALADGVNVFAGYSRGYQWTSADPGALVEGLHPINATYQGQAAIWWLNLLEKRDPTYFGTGSGGGGAGGSRGSNRIGL